jgi:hypothetical protein
MWITLNRFRALSSVGMTCNVGFCQAVQYITEVSKFSSLYRRLLFVAIGLLSPFKVYASQLKWLLCFIRINNTDFISDKWLKCACIVLLAFSICDLIFCLRPVSCQQWFNSVFNSHFSIIIIIIIIIMFYEKKWKQTRENLLLVDLFLC